MASKKGVFATTINCIDGRVQVPVIEWLRKQYDADYVDAVTLPGPDKHIHLKDEDLMSEIRKSVEISHKAHKSDVLAIVGHHDCAANDVGKERHKQEIREFVEMVQGTWDISMIVIGLYVNDKWEIEEVRA